MFRRIVSELAVRGLQRNAKQCHKKLKALKRRSKEVIDKHKRSRAGVESEEEGTQVDFRFYAQIHRVLGSRAVVNPPQLLEIGTPQSSASSESSAPLAQAACSRLLSSSSRQSTPKVLTLPPPVTEEVEEEDTHEPSADQSATELPVAEPEQSAPVTVPEQSASATEPATQQSVPGPSHAKK